ncbi:MAG TPA: alpha/beta hydrolase [Tepidisphaeraceae bacterium]|nr:alpha/beta hydrolase [Tepidisphaeraceae bacterium]
MFSDVDESTLPMIFLPGLNGDARVFAPQLERFPSLIVARWQPPLKSDSLAAYAARLARSLDPDGPCLVGGVSFGGIVALEVARNLEARACLLIASSQDAKGLPATIRLLRPVAAVANAAALNCTIHHGGMLAASSSRRLRRRIARLSPEELRFRRWALKALLTWQPPSLSCPVLQIHGECDSTFAHSRSQADVVVRNAGHLLTLTHADQVNAFISSALFRYGFSARAQTQAKVEK